MWSRLKIPLRRQKLCVSGGTCRPAAPYQLRTSIFMKGADRKGSCARTAARTAARKAARTAPVNWRNVLQDGAGAIEWWKSGLRRTRPGSERRYQPARRRREASTLSSDFD